jgi:hypothetical protein
MRKILLAIVSFAVIAFFPPLASAQDRTAVGVGTGAVAGAIVGGPIGAAVGGVVGGFIGASTKPHRYRVYRANRKPVDTNDRGSRAGRRPVEGGNVPHHSPEFRPFG